MHRGALLLNLAIVLALCSCYKCSCPDDNGSGVAIAELYAHMNVSPTSGKRSEAQYQVLVTDDRGNPLAKKRVDWHLIDGDAVLYYKTVTTDEDGLAQNWANPTSELGITTSSVTVRASVFGYDAATTLVAEAR